MAYKILLITADQKETWALNKALSDSRDGPFSIDVATDIVEALQLLSEYEFSIVLLDLELKKSPGLTAFETVFLAVPYLPILVLCSPNNEEMARQSVQCGAQGFLTKGVTHNYLVPQELHTVIDRKSVEESLFIEKERAQVTLNSIGDAVLSTDVNGKVSYLNPIAEDLTGWSRDQAMGRSIDEVFCILDSETRASLPNPVTLVLRHDKCYGLQTNTLLVRRDGMEFIIEDAAAPIHDQRGRLTGVVIVFHDASEMRRRDTQMAHLAQHDFLTDLPNRMLLRDRITQAISRARRDHHPLVVLFLDLDNFKQINDSLGHAMGDLLLQSVARRLSSCVRSADTVSRQGGDEFVVLACDDMEEVDACLIAEKILGAFSAPHIIGGHELHISTSVGVSTYPSDGLDAETLVKNADTAMYHAKRSGRNNYKFFTSDMNLRAQERQRLEAQLRNALAGGELVVVYQPKFSLASGDVTGTEALLRWQHPEQGLLNSTEFMHIAEESGLIVPIGRWVMREACNQAARWGLHEKLAMTISVNVCEIEFSQPDFASHLEAVLKASGLAPEALCIDLTERVIMRTPESSMTRLRALKKMGVRLAIDDFGTGYSNLSYLSQLPIDTLKIDRSFVQDITGSGLSAKDGMIASVVIAMGASLRHTVVAEGIETQAQLDFLKNLDCEEGQGFYFSEPVVADAMNVLLQTKVRPSGHFTDLH